MEERTAPLERGEVGIGKKVEGVVSEKSEVMNGFPDCGNSRGQT